MSPSSHAVVRLDQSITFLMSLKKPDGSLPVNAVTQYPM